MRKMIRTGIAMALVVGAGAGCKKKGEEAAGSGSATASGSGSATASGSGSASGSAAGSGSSAAPTPLAPDAVAAWYASCWGHFNDRAWDKFAGCYAADAVSDDLPSGQTQKGQDAILANVKGFTAGFSDMKGEPQLTLVNGNQVFSVSLMTGTHDGTLKTPMGEIPATKQKVGLLTAHLLEVDLATGKVTHERWLSDSASMMGQLGLAPEGMPFRPALAEGWGEKPVVVAKGDDAEKANVAAYTAGLETFNKHDVKAIKDGYAAGAVWSDMTSPADVGVDEMVKGLEGFLKGFPDMKLEATSVWGAGDYVVAIGTVSGTNTGTLKEMGLDKSGKKFASPFVEVDQLKDGKVVHAWLFSDNTSMAMQLGLMPPPGGAPPQ